MLLKIATWNVNSVRLRLPDIERFVAGHAPDILCLQETKCPDDRFPLNAFRRLGYGHSALNGQKGWHGVAILSRLPFDTTSRHDVCGCGQARHVAIELGRSAGLAAPLILHDLYVPAGGDLPDPEANPKFAHKLAFMDGLIGWADLHRGGAAGRAILVGDLNIAPLEHDVWSHRQLLDVVSHTPVECERMARLAAAGGWVDAMRRFVPPTEKLYTWWSYRSPDWAAADKGRRLDHVWVTPSLADGLVGMHVAREMRGTERPSDHAPVIVTLDM